MAVRRIYLVLFRSTMSILLFGKHGQNAEQHEAGDHGTAPVAYKGKRDARQRQEFRHACDDDEGLQEKYDRDASSKQNARLFPAGERDAYGTIKKQGDTIILQMDGMPAAWKLLCILRE